MVKISLALVMAAALLSLAVASPSTVTGTSGFTAPGNSLAFAVNLPDDGTNDLYFSLSAKSDLSWSVSCGHGNDQMLNTLVFMMYQDSTGENIILSPRLSPQFAEPVYLPAINLSLLSGTGVSDGKMQANAVCHNCRNWSMSSINPSDMESPFIFARGPYQSFKSSSVSASVMIHEEFGSFTMNLSQAIGPAQIPNTTTGITGKAIEDIVSTSHYLTVMHGYLMFTSIVIVMPAGALVIRCMPESRITHVITQSLGVILTLCGFYYGMVVSSLYNRSNNFLSAHQLFGFSIFISLVYQAFMGFRLRRARAAGALQQDSVLFHIWLGRFVVMAGIVNSFLGIELSYRLTQLGPYFGAVVAVWVIFECVAFILWVYKHIKRREPEADDVTT